jgi:Ser/Thr protein kinase RdoA (MazF antagonist)
VAEIDEPRARTIVHKALHSYDLAEAALHFVKYRENHVFRAEQDGESFAVRLHRRGVHSTAAVRTELAYLAALRDRGVPVSVLVPTRAGDVVCLVTDDDGAEYQVDVQRWVEDALPLGDIGEAFDGSSQLAAADFHRLGQIAGDLHNHMQELGRLPGFSRAAWDLDGLVGEKALWGDPLALGSLTADDRDALRGAIARLRSELASLGTGPEVYGLIHADFTPENILVRGDEFVLIDFDDFGEGWHLFELATIVFFFRPHPRFAEYSEAVIAGYRTRRHLGEDQLRLWTGMLLARGVTYLGWAAERAGDETSEFIAAHVAPVVVSLARDFLSERAELTDKTSCRPVVLAQEMGAQAQAWRNERKQAHMAARPGRCHSDAEEIDS